MFKHHKLKSILFRNTRGALGLFLAIATLLLAVRGVFAAPVAPDEPPWWAQYFANRTLTGPSVLHRQDAAINFNWGLSSPGEAVPADNFSARWSKDEWFTSGTYRFTARADDGLRVWVDDDLIIDAWYDQQATWIIRDAYVDQGMHAVKVEYYEHGGSAVVQLDWERITGGAGWYAEYYANKNLEGAPVLTRTDSAISFAWEGGSPGADVPSDGFSARWIRALSLPAGTYRFHAASDDGVRLWVGDRLLIDAWYRQGLPNDHHGDVVLEGNTQQVKVEYFEDGGGAHVHVWWERLEDVEDWKAQYYDNPDLHWPPVMTRDDAQINFDWGTAPPVPWMPDDNFSVVWSKEMTFDPGFYRISVQADDGVRVWLDETRLMIDKWEPMDYELHYVDGTYLEGKHQFRVEYFERNGHARIKFWVVPTPWKAEYFDNPDLAGEPEVVHLHESLDADWGYGAPWPGLPADDFSVRWTTEQNFGAGTYTFILTADDAATLYIDGTEVLDVWLPVKGSGSVRRYLSAGEHTIEVNYLERRGPARVSLTWEP